MRVTFRSWLGIGPGEEIDVDYATANYLVMRGREYSRCQDARRVLNRIAKVILPKILESDVASAPGPDPAVPAPVTT